MVLNRRHFIVAAGAAGSVGFYGAGARAQSAAAAKANTSGNGKGKAAASTILVLGDSLSAEYGLRRGSGWVALLEQKLRSESISAQVVNASISGDTTSGGRSRLPALLEQHKPSHVIIELGGNDALRGLPLQMTQDNLGHMTDLARQAGAKVVLVGMQVPPNYGSDYANRFASLFEEAARDHGAALVPFLLKGVADGEDATRLFQSDRIHPTAQAQPIMLANVWPVLRKLLP
ncbi:MAG: arylesterase [Burkholderiaceae bacterium]|nr:arylesterase [Rhodoferax sp.]MCB2029110.1 arylesterase [Rhodoferax sp.]MCB2041491.1 arylesterase [Rhodoferax sp.]MCP5260522.1 arylesterase [Rhodoferax sp.]MCW5628039.1 arylesterase [Rhodoferax sp.]